MMPGFIISEGAKAAPVLTEQKAYHLKEVVCPQGYVPVVGSAQAVLPVGREMSRGPACLVRINCIFRVLFPATSDRDKLSPQGAPRPLRKAAT